MPESKNIRIVAIFAGIAILFLFFGLYLAHLRDLKQAGYRPTFLGSAVSLLDSFFFDSLNSDEGNFAFPNVPENGVVTLNSLNKLADGLFSADPLTLYQGGRYNLRVALGDNVRPEILKNYYINFVKDGIVYTLDAKTETPVTNGIFTSRILTKSARSNGSLDVAPGQYDGYVNVVWDTGTQTIRFTVNVLPERVVVQPVSITVQEPIVPNPLPPVTIINPQPPVVPALFASIQQLEVRDSNGVSYVGVYNYQNNLWAYGRMFTNSTNGLVYNLSLVARDNASRQYYISAGNIDGSGTKEIRFPMPALNTIPTGVYDLTLLAAPRLVNGGVGSFVTAKQSITLVNDSNQSQPVSIIVPPTPQPTPTPTGDGNVTFTGTININTDNLISGRSCADGGDAVNYSVLGLTQNTATLHKSPASGCLTQGDEVLIINLQGTPNSYSAVGNYELLRIQSISGSTITFTTNKKRFYGENGDANIGISASNQRVMLQRVPNYANATVNSGASVIANAWNGVRGGVVAFRANGTLTNNGKISADSLGYRGGWTPGMQGEGRLGTGITVAHCGSYSANYYGSGTGANDLGGGAHHCYGSGAGGGNATLGANGYGNAIAGASFATSNSVKLIMGGGGGAAAGAVGANGGGIALILANTFSSSGLINASGVSAPGPCGVGTYTYGGGGGAGGSVFLVGNSANASLATANGGQGLSCAYTGGNGGSGRVDSVTGL